MVGLKHLSGVMILSKPSLLAGFDNPSSKDNVGVHEFVHLVEKKRPNTVSRRKFPGRQSSIGCNTWHKNFPILPRIIPTSTATHTRTNTNSLRFWPSISSSRRICYRERTRNCTRCSGRCSTRTPDRCCSCRPRPPAIRSERSLPVWEREEVQALLLVEGC